MIGCLPFHACIFTKYFFFQPYLSLDLVVRSSRVYIFFLKFNKTQNLVFMNVIDWWAKPFLQFKCSICTQYKWAITPGFESILIRLYYSDYSVSFELNDVLHLQKLIKNKKQLLFKNGRLMSHCMTTDLGMMKFTRNPASSIIVHRAWNN